MASGGSGIAECQSARIESLKAALADLPSDHYELAPGEFTFHDIAIADPGHTKSYYHDQAARLVKAGRASVVGRQPVKIDGVIRSIIVYRLVRR